MYFFSKIQIRLQIKKNISIFSPINPVRSCTIPLSWHTVPFFFIHAVSFCKRIVPCRSIYLIVLCQPFNYVLSLPLPFLVYLCFFFYCKRLSSFFLVYRRYWEIMIFESLKLDSDFSKEQNYSENVILLRLSFAVSK